MGTGERVLAAVADASAATHASATHFLYAGAGYGGSCFPKDVKALIKTAHGSGVELKVLKAVEAANERQKHVLVDKVVARFGENLAGRQFGIWGLAFKPNTPISIPSRRCSGSRW